MPQFQTLLDALQHWAKVKPDCLATIFRNGSHQQQQRRHVMTWSTLYRLSGRFAATLKSTGLGRGHFVLNTLPNSPERVVCEAGVWMSGAASVSGRYLQADCSDLLHSLRVSRAQAVLLDPDIQDGPWHVLKKHITLDDDGNVESSSSFTSLQKVVFVRRVENQGDGDFLKDLEERTEWFQADDVSSDDVLTVFTTSGTTGFSKLVVHSHGNLLDCLKGGAFVDSYVQSPVQLNLTPLGWAGGSLPLFVVPGVTRVACDLRAGVPEDMPQFIWTTIQEEKCTSIKFSPTLTADVVKVAKAHIQKCKADPSTPAPWEATTILLLGIPFTRSMIQEGLTLAHEVCVQYGATDAGSVAGHIVTSADSVLDYDVGKPLPGTQVKIVNTKNEDEELLNHQVGHVLVKVPHTMKGYLNDPQATEAAFTKDGLFRTGDLGRMDERGHLFVEGRSSDAILRGDSIFSPTWMEQKILESLGVKAVTIVGVPDPLLREELCACVVLDSEEVSLEDVRRFVEKAVAEGHPSSPVPRYYLRFDSHPMTDTGKPRRGEVKAQAARLLGLSRVSD